MVLHKSLCVLRRTTKEISFCPWALAELSGTWSLGVAGCGSGVQLRQAHATLGPYLQVPARGADPNHTEEEEKICR